MEETFAIIKPDAWGKPWIENVLERNDAEEEPAPADDDEDDPDAPRPVREQWKTVQTVRAPDMGAEILKRIERAGFEIVKRKTMLLTPKVSGRNCCRWTRRLIRAFLTPRTLLSSTRSMTASPSTLVS